MGCQHCVDRLQWVECNEWRSGHTIVQGSYMMTTVWHSILSLERSSPIREMISSHYSFYTTRLYIVVTIFVFPFGVSLIVYHASGEVGRHEHWVVYVDQVKMSTFDKQTMYTYLRRDRILNY